MKLKNLWVITMIVSSLFLIPAFSIEAADTTITDGVGDVISVDYLTGETNVITNSPDIDVDNLDLIQATYTQQGVQATLSLQVVGNIENRGKIIDPYSDDIFDTLDTVEYDFQLITSGQDYSVSYSNQTGQLINGFEQINLTSSDFSVVGDTLSITFSLISADEIYENLSVTSTYIKIKGNFSVEDPSIVFLSDVAPNPPLMIYEAYAPDNGFLGESIQFNASVEPLTGQPPYTYRWDFGDQGTSTELNPTHTYTKAGFYMYTFTVTDSAEATASKSGTITIYELKKVLLFGRFMNMKTEGDYITVESVNLRMILFKPFQFLHYIAGEKIGFSNQYNGIIIANHFLIGMFNVVIGPVPPPNIACTTDSTTNRITVATADANIKWRDIAITTDNQAVSWRVYSADGVAIDAWNHTNGAGLAEMIAGDYIQLQFNVTTLPTNVRVTFRYIPTNALLGTWTVNV